MHPEYDPEAAAEAAVADFPPLTPEQASHVAQLLGLANGDER